MYGVVDVNIPGRKELFFYAGVGPTGQSRSLVQIPVLDDADFVVKRMMIVGADGATFGDAYAHPSISRNGRMFALNPILTNVMGIGDRSTFAEHYGLPALQFIERKSSFFVDLVKATGTFAVAPYVVLEGWKIYPNSVDDVPARIPSNNAELFYLGNNFDLTLGQNNVEIQAQADGDAIAKALQIAQADGTDIGPDALIKIRDNNGKDWNNIPVPVYTIANRRANGTTAFTPFAFPRLIPGNNVIQIQLTTTGAELATSINFHAVKVYRRGAV